MHGLTLLSLLSHFFYAQVIINENNLADVQAEYEGPSGTPYEGGVFRMKLVLGSDFPSAPPKGKSFLLQSLHLQTP